MLAGVGLAELEYPALRTAGDLGIPAVLAAPDAPSSVGLTRIAAGLPVVRRGLVGRALPLSVL